MSQQNLAKQVTQFENVDDAHVIKYVFLKKKLKKKNLDFFSDFDRVPPMKNRNRGENPPRPGPRTGDPGPGAPRGPRPVAALQKPNIGQPMLQKRIERISIWENHSDGTLH